MSIHQEDKNMQPDSEFLQGDLEFLVEGNQCRLLDGRRTPGQIENVFFDSGLFRWRISRFEDQGKYWDLPIEEFSRFQFTKDSKKLPLEQVDELRSIIKIFDKSLEIECSESNCLKTKEIIFQKESYAKDWLKDHSNFFSSKKKSLEYHYKRGPKELCEDLTRYMISLDLLELEKNTSETYVLNPRSGEWIKGMQIVLAECGLRPFYGKMARTTDIFEGIGTKENRLRYITARLGFMSAVFSLFEVDEVVLYRGMATEFNWKNGKDKPFSSWTFSREVAESFSALDHNSHFKHSYLLKRSMPIEKLFMTYLETEAMNNQYQEVEAVVLHQEVDRMLW